MGKLKNVEELVIRVSFEVCYSGKVPEKIVEQLKQMNEEYFFFNESESSAEDTPYPEAVEFVVDKVWELREMSSNTTYNVDFLALED